MVRFTQDIVSTVVEAVGGEKKANVLAKISVCECSARDAAFQVLGALSRELRKEDDPDAKYWKSESESSQAIPDRRDLAEGGAVERSRARGRVAGNT
jgi:hypothetical protein